MWYLRWLVPPFILWQIRAFCLLFLQHEALPASVLLLKKMISIVVPLHSVVHYPGWRSKYPLRKRNKHFWRFQNHWCDRKKMSSRDLECFYLRRLSIKTGQTLMWSMKKRLWETTSIEGSLQSLSDTLMVDKILCMCDSEYMSPSETLLRKYFPELSIARSSDSLLEIMAGGINKAEAVKYLCDLLKNPSYQYYCIQEIIIMIWKCWRQ